MNDHRHKIWGKTMTREALIKSVKKKYAGADVATIDAVLKTLAENDTDLAVPRQKAPGSNDKTARPVKKRKQQFIGKHLTLEEYRKLSLDERGDFKQRLKEQNHKWLEEKFAKLRAIWLMVMDSEIIAFGNSMRDYPSVEKICEIGKRYGKRPFIFINDLFVAIEESTLAWHPTIYDDDFYPTVPITLSTDSDSINVAADFDTGAAASFADYDILYSHAIIKAHDDEEAETSAHLGQVFKYISKTIDIEIKISSKKTLQKRLPIFCVPNWQTSPFVSINPQRQALAGRDLFLELKPNILLDFANRQTKILAAKMA